MAEPNFANRTLYHGDNLDFLRGMNSETVHLIATDPPFKKGKDFHATPGSLAAGARFQDRWSWDRDVHEEWTDSIIDDWPAVWEVILAARSAYGDDMGAYLCWLGVRLMEMHRVLREDGSLFLHIDHTAHAYVKCILDAVFGARNFRNEIVWVYGLGGSSKRYFSRKHDTILFYSKTDSYYFDKPQVPATSQRMKGQMKGMLDTWSDIPSLNNQAKERTGFPTQKPLALYRRIIEASSKEGDFVLDPFCGCATTPVAAEQLDRWWVGMDIWDGAIEAVKDQLRQFWLFTPEESGKIMFPHEVAIETISPSRTDDNEVAAPSFKLRTRRPVEPWQRITHKGITNVLAEAQGTDGGVICAGCGRVLEREFMQLDHITPKSDRGENHILNRILLCGPCNQRKRDRYTLRGLLGENKKVKWMKEESRAKLAQDSARDKAEWTRDNFDSEECQNLIKGLPV